MMPVMIQVYCCEYVHIINGFYCYQHGLSRHDATGMVQCMCSIKSPMHIMIKELSSPIFSLLFISMYDTLFLMLSVHLRTSFLVRPF